MKIIGETALETVAIDRIAYSNSFSEFSLLRETVATVLADLISNGFIDARLQSLTEETERSFSARLAVGTYYRSTVLKVPNDSTLMSHINKSGLEVKQDTLVVETAFAKAWLEQLASIAADNGNPFASFKITDIEKKANKLYGRLQFNTDQKRQLDKVVIKGYENIPKAYLSRYARIKKGQPFNTSKLLQQNDLLDNLPFIKSIKEPEVLFTQDSTITYFYLEKQQINQFEGFIGFASNTETNRVRLDGYVDLILTNNLNYGERFLLNYKSDGNGQTQLNTSVTLPYLFQSPIGAEAKLALFRKDSTFSTNQQEVKIFYQISSNWQSGIGYNATQSENLQDGIMPSIENTVDFRSNNFFLDTSFNLPQENFLFPQKATFSISGRLGNRSTAIETLNQIGLLLNGKWILNLNRKNSIFLNSDTRTLWSDNYLTNELYRFGGITSIRGFEENSIFANLLSTLSTEYRYTFGQSLYLHSVIDVGYFENPLLEQKSTLFSFGIGAGIKTKAGILRFILANGKNENQNFDFNNTKLHFMLATQF